MQLLVIFWLGAVTGGAIQSHYADVKAEADAAAVSIAPTLAPIEVRIIAEGEGK